MGSFKAGRIIFRTDASPTIGSGHLLRCLALAQACHEIGGKATFALTVNAGWLENRLKLEGISVDYLSTSPGSREDAQFTAALAKKEDANWIVIDGYQFGDNYQRYLENRGFQLLVIDDYGHIGQYSSNFVLDQNINTDESFYGKKAASTQLLLGNQFALLRNEFRSYRRFTREISSNGRRILVTLGGSSRNEPIFTILSALSEVKSVKSELECVVIMGGSSQYSGEIRSCSEELALSICIKDHVESMAELMAWADLAVSGAGTTCWELAYMGLPSIVIVLAENQSMLGQGVHSAGLALNLGWYHNITASRMAKSLIPLLANASERKAMSQRGQTLIDGDGTDRVLMYLTNQPFRLRPVREEDCKLIWEWANEPGARAASFSEEIIPWEDHLAWFNSKLQDPNCFLYIAVNRDEKPIGQVRYDINDTEAVISVNLEKESRGKGYGNLLIGMSAKRLFSSAKIDAIHAFIKAENATSIRAFLKAGYEEVEMEYPESKKARHFLLEQRALQNG